MRECGDIWTLRYLWAKYPKSRDWDVHIYVWVMRSVLYIHHTSILHADGIMSVQIMLNGMHICKHHWIFSLWHRMNKWEGLEDVTVQLHFASIDNIYGILIPIHSFILSQTEMGKCERATQNPYTISMGLEACARLFIEHKSSAKWIFQCMHNHTTFCLKQNLQAKVNLRLFSCKNFANNIRIP